MFLDPRAEGGFRHRPDFRRNDLTAFKNHQRWNAAHMKLSRRFWIIINIDFRNRDLLAHFIGQIFKCRADLLTRSTPFRSKIYQDGLIRFDNIGFKT